MVNRDDFPYYPKFVVLVVIISLLIACGILPSPTPEVAPRVDISVSSTEVKVGDTITVIGVPEDIGLPYYYLYANGEEIVRATNFGEVKYPEIPSNVLEVITVDASMSQVTFVLRALETGKVEVYIHATGEIHTESGATWAGGISEGVQVNVEK